MNVPSTDISNEIKKAIDILWDKAYSYGPSIEHWTGNEYIATSDIVQKVKDYDLDRVVKILQKIIE